ncbi:MAG: hypothetical protein ACKPKO_34050, partial [Candidatus Fonsibacter sp.]
MVAFRGAKAKYLEAKKSRGYANKDKGSHGQKGREKRLAEIKAKSVCSRCKQKGHWHNDDVCPMKGKGDPAHVRVHMAGFAVHKAYIIGEYVDTAGHGILDTGCSRTVAGLPWVEDFMDKLHRAGRPTVAVPESEGFRFGASRVHRSSFALLAPVGVGGRGFV